MILPSELIALNPPGWISPSIGVSTTENSDKSRFP